MKLKIKKISLKANWLKRICSLRKNNKFQLAISEDALKEIKYDFENLKNKKQYIKVNQVAYHYSHKNLRGAQKCYKKFDRTHLLMALLDYTLKSAKIKNDEQLRYLKVMKYATLLTNYTGVKSDNKLLSEAQKIYQILLLKNSYEISPAFGAQIQTIILDKVYQHSNIDLLTELKLNNFNHQQNWDMLLNLMVVIFQTFNIPNSLDIATSTIQYYFLKKEMAFFGTKKFNSIVKDTTEYTFLSDAQLIISQQLSNALKTIDVEFKTKYFRFLSETEGKLYLSDNPPLTVSGIIGLTINYAILLLWVLIILWPVYQLIKASFNVYSKEKINTSNFLFAFDNFNHLFEKTYYGQWIQNSLIVAFTTMFFTVIVISLIGYAFSRFRFRGKKSGLMTIMLLQMIPTFTAIIAFYVIYRLLNDGVDIPPLMVMVLIYTGGGIAGNTFVLKGYLDNISTEIDDAARIDGCSNWKIYLQIIVPLARPMLAIIALWSFIGPFGDIILPQLLLPTVEDYTAASGLSTLINDPNKMAQGSYAAGALLIGLPITILFIVLQKNITGGLAAAGVKG